MVNDISSSEIKQLVEDQVNLPSPPAIAVQILSTVQQQDYSLNDLEKIISADAALTGKMLRIANSAFYSLPTKISNVSRALAVLGTNVIKNIALSFVIASDLKGESNRYFNFDYFWRRSVTAAVAAELVSAKLNLVNEDIFVSALLQDIGVLVMYINKGEEYDDALKNCIIHGGTGLIQSEHKKFQFDHQQLGYVLLKDWGLPESITLPLRFHHEPESAPENVQKIASILDVANFLSAIYSGTETIANLKKLEEKMEDYFSFDSDETRKILDQVALQSIAILDIFEVDASNLKPYSQILQEANDELGKLNLSYEQLVLELKESKEKSERFARELQEANAKLEQLAFKDGLTGIFNHRYFQEILDKEMARAKRYGHPLGLLLFDIDYFKKVNDSYGHPAGDKVLINLAQQISNTIRPSDIIARYGGEEFAVILPETKGSGLKVFAERLRRCAANLTTSTENGPIQVTISCGGALLSPTDSINKQNFIDIVDRALYQSKDKGRNRVTVLQLP